MAEAYSPGRVAIDTMDTMPTIIGKATARCGGVMALSTKETGTKASKVELDTYSCQMVL